jgi:hypothetical protein
VALREVTLLADADTQDHVPDGVTILRNDRSQANQTAATQARAGTVEVGHAVVDAVRLVQHTDVSANGEARSEDPHHRPTALRQDALVPVGTQAPVGAVAPADPGGVQRLVADHRTRADAHAPGGELAHPHRVDVATNAPREGNARGEAEVGLAVLRFRRLEALDALLEVRHLVAEDLELVLKLLQLVTEPHDPAFFGVHERLQVEDSVLEGLGVGIDFVDRLHVLRGVSFLELCTHRAQTCSQTCDIFLETSDLELQELHLRVRREGVRGVEGEAANHHGQQHDGPEEGLVDAAHHVSSGQKPIKEVFMSFRGRIARFISLSDPISTAARRVLPETGSLSG